MESKVEISNSRKPVQVLLIGNNPIDMGRVLEKLNQIRGAQVVTEIAFDLKSILQQLVTFRPNFILIDDNIGKHELTQTIQTLSNRRKTKDIPITVLKNSNYNETYTSNGVLNFVLKNNLSADSLYNAIRNSLKFRKTHLYLLKVYNKRRGALKRLLSRAS
jgi:DNA-binding NarL/FixJ family response regulator